MLHSDSVSVQENRRHKALFFAPWKCESGFGKTAMRGSCDWDTSVNNSCAHSQAWQPRQGRSLTPPPHARCRLVGLDSEWCAYSDARAPPLQREEKLGVTCLGQCWQPHALKRISLATAIPPPLLCLLKLGVDWWYSSISCLALEFCISRYTARALKLF